VPRIYITGLPDDERVKEHINAAVPVRLIALEELGGITEDAVTVTTLKSSTNNGRVHMRNEIKRTPERNDETRRLVTDTVKPIVEEALETYGHPADVSGGTIFLDEL